jgi:hypothetical protein
LEKYDSPRRRKGAEKIVVVNELTEKIIGALIEVHKSLGPGLLESAYEGCLTHELTDRHILRLPGASAGDL